MSQYNNVPVTLNYDVNDDDQEKCIELLKKRDELLLKYHMSEKRQIEVSSLISALKNQIKNSYNPNNPRDLSIIKKLQKIDKYDKLWNVLYQASLKIKRDISNIDTTLKQYKVVSDDEDEIDLEIKELQKQYNILI
jgi:hypothetical protein